MKTETLQVPGASLYYEVRSSCPLLLMIPGGPMDAGGFQGIAVRLADTYTVVTYDCRGNSRSPMQGSWDDLTVALFAHDAHRLLDAVSTDQADALGSAERPGRRDLPQRWHVRGPADVREGRRLRQRRAARAERADAGRCGGEGPDGRQPGAVRRAADPDHRQLRARPGGAAAELDPHRGGRGR